MQRIRTDGETGGRGDGGNAEIVPQLGLFANDAGMLQKKILELNLDAMTPIEALNKLHELKNKVNGSG